MTTTTAILIIIYLIIGAIFGELSLVVNKNNETAVKRLTYFFAVVSWPLVIMMAIISGHKRGKG